MTELHGAGVVITGGGAGIGAALARRFAAAGARVVVNDLNADGADAVAAEVKGWSVPGDASSVEGAAALIEAARGHLGEIDVYCANAGVGAGEGLDAAEADWELSWNVNVMAHVRAARVLMPAWLERGHGHFLSTVSAAGLLSMLGTPTYSVTKHGALAFSEWLAATYGHRGITVQALCPLGVKTAMLSNSGKAGQTLLMDKAISPEEVADVVAEAVADGRFLILPHPEVAGYYAGRANDTDQWLAGMNHLQQLIEAAN
jgi:NAD(P)-dependent dehydrogenase (short-subunit alcohol dehydrogenase family)